MTWRRLERKSFAEVEAADFGVGDEVVRGAGAEDAAFGHYVGAVGDGEGFADVVVGDEDSDALLFEIEDDLADVVDGERVDAGEGFVEEDELRLGCETAGDLDAAAFTAGKGVAAGASDVGDAEFFEQLVEPLETLSAFYRHCFQHGEDVLLGGHFAKDRRLLRQVSKTETRTQVHRQMRNVATVEVDRSGLGRLQPDQHVEARCLARSVCSEQADDLALIYVKTDIVDHSPTAVCLLQILRGDRSFTRFGNVMPVGFG